MGSMHLLHDSVDGWGKGTGSWHIVNKLSVWLYDADNVA